MRGVEETRRREEPETRGCFSFVFWSLPVYWLQILKPRWRRPKSKMAGGFQNIHKPTGDVTMTTSSEAVCYLRTRMIPTRVWCRLSRLHLSSRRGYPAEARKRRWADRSVNFASSEAIHRRSNMAHKYTHARTRTKTHTHTHSNMLGYKEV